MEALHIKPKDPKGSYTRKFWTVSARNSLMSKIPKWRILRTWENASKSGATVFSIKYVRDTKANRLKFKSA